MFVSSWRGSPEIRAKADAIFADTSLVLVASSLVRLELAPHAQNTSDEIALFQGLFSMVHEWVPLDDLLAERAAELRTTYGIASLDALHLAAAEISRVDRFVTTEKPSRPLYRAKHLFPTFLGDF